MELLIVIIIIGLLAAIVIVSYSNVTRQATDSKMQQYAQDISKKLAIYAAENGGDYPVSLSALNLGISDAALQYHSDNNSNPSTYCVSASRLNSSFFVDNQTQVTPAKGVCSGQVSAGQTVTNLILKPSFEDGWGMTAGNPYDYSFSVSTDRAFSGSSSFKIVAPSTVADAYVENGNALGTQVPPGKYTFSIWVYISGSGHGVTNANRGIWAYLTPSCYSQLYIDQSKQNQWQRLSVTCNNTASSNLWVRLYAPTDSTVYYDAMMLTAGDQLYDYFDGDSTGFKWNGTPRDSASYGLAF